MLVIFFSDVISVFVCFTSHCMADKVRSLRMGSPKSYVRRLGLSDLRSWSIHLCLFLLLSTSFSKSALGCIVICSGCSRKEITLKILGPKWTPLTIIVSTLVSTSV